jgi:hypothetical protein
MISIQSMGLYISKGVFTEKRPIMPENKKSEKTAKASIFLVRNYSKSKTKGLSNNTHHVITE